MPKILLVEDDARLRKCLGLCLRQQGCDVVEVASVEEAMQELAAQTFQLVVTDYLLSTTLDGLFLLGYLKDNFPGLPAILMSGSQNRGLEPAARAMGAFRFLRKPLDLNVFLSTCSRAREMSSPHGVSFERPGVCYDPAA